MKTDLLQQAFDPSAFRARGHQLVDLLAVYLEELEHSPDTAPVMPDRLPDELHQKYKVGCGNLEDLFHSVLQDSMHIHHPGYAGHQVSPSIPLAALAGLLSDFLNNGMGVYEMGPAANAVEREVIFRVATQFGFSSKAGGFLTSGGTLANLTALLTARSIKSQTQIWKDGHSAPLALLVSEQAHYCVDRAIRIMGWGEKGIIKVPVDPDFRMRTDLLPYYLNQAQEEGRQVIAVVGSACTTATGSFDNLEAIGTFCQEHNLWFHVDGAHGAAVCYSSKYRDLVKGIHLADSVTMDFHKMLLTPAITTALIYKNDQYTYATFQQQAAYLWQNQEAHQWYNPAKRTFECTKLMMGLKPYVLLNEYGSDLFDEYVTRVLDRTASFARIVEEDAVMELALEPQCNILCFRFANPNLPEKSANRINAAIRERVVRKGEFYLVETVLNGTHWLRCTFTNPFFDINRFKGLVRAIKQEADQVLDHYLSAPTELNE